MSPFPKPPMNNRDPEIQAHSVQPKATPPDIGPPPNVEIPDLGLEDTALSDNEMNWILDKCLTSKQRSDARLLKWLGVYLSCRDNGQACAAAGVPTHRGRGWLRNPEVYDCINQITAKGAMKYGYDAAEIVERTKEIAAVDPVVFENPDGTYKTHLSQIAPEARRAIKRFKVKNLFGEDRNGMRTVVGQLIEVELYDKLKGIELLAREKNTFKETKKIEHDVTARMGAVLLESARRAEERAALPASTTQSDSRDVIEVAAPKEEKDGQG